MSIPVSPMRNQCGAVLIIALVFLLLLTIIGVGAMRSAVLQERMAGNFRDLNVAFQAAEAAVRAAERYLDGTPAAFNDTNGLYAHCDNIASCSLPDWQDRNPSPNPWRARQGDIAGAAQTAEYIIQEVSVEWDVTGAGNVEMGGTVQYREFHQITARGYGSTDRTMVVLQTMYKRDI